MGCHVGGLAVIRSLGRMKIPIIAMTYNSVDFADVSKYVSEKVVIPHPKNEKEFTEFLVKNSHKWRGALIIESDDYAAISLAKNKEILKEYYKIVTPDWTITKLFIEKDKTSDLAQEAGVPHPITFIPKSIDQLTEFADKLMFPCILKPIEGHTFKAFFGRKNFQVNNVDELFNKFKICHEARQPVMIQEIIPGPDTEIYNLQAYVNSAGKISAKFFNKKVRQHPPQFGEGRVAVSTSRNEEVERLSERLLHQTKYRGYCSIEFKKDPRDNKLKLIELNVRNVRYSLLAIKCGVNFPYIIYLDLIKNSQIEVTDYLIDTYWIELHTDLFSSLFRRKRENFTFKDYLKPYRAQNRVLAVFAKDDWMPFIKRSYKFLPFTK